MARLLMRCGCEQPFVDGESPQCQTHACRIVARVLGMPKPRIRGTAQGPLVQTVDLEPFVGRLVGSESKDA
jgi:hypothetical protein